VTLSSLVLPGRFSDSDSLSLALKDHRPLELCDCDEHRQQQQRIHRRVIACEGQRLFDELHLDTAAGEFPNDPATVFEVTGKTVRRVDHQRVTEFDSGGRHTVIKDADSSR